MALAVSEQSLLVANRSGSVSIVDTARARVVGEATVGERLSDLAAVPDGQRLVAVDEERNELILLEHEGGKLSVLERLKVATAPVSVRVSADGSFCSVASLWARRLTLVSIGEDEGRSRLRALGTIDLPFAPREQWLDKSGRALCVADSFRGRLAIVDTRSQNICQNSCQLLFQDY